MPEEIPAVWRKSFSRFSDDSLHLLAKLYLSGNNYSRKLTIEALYHHANREEFKHKSFAGLSSFDTQLLLLLYLELHNIQQLADNLSEYSPIEICLQLLHLQERMLVLQIDHKGKSSSRENRESLIPKIEKQLQAHEGASFIIAPQFVGQLRQRLDFRVLFHGLTLPAKYRQNWDIPKLLLSSELVLASALYFAQKGFSLKRKISKTQLAKCRHCFPQLNDKQVQQLQQLSLACGLLREDKQHQVLFSLEAFEQLWRIPYYQRLLSLQARIAKLSQAVFAKLLSIWPQHTPLPSTQLQRLLLLMGLHHPDTISCIQTMQDWQILLKITDCPDPVSPTEKGPYFLLNPRLYDSIMGAEGPVAKEQRNRLSSNWEFYCDLRHPENYIELLLCARLERFAQLSLFHIEKPLFQKYFNAETSKFERFLEQIPQLERCGIHISELIRQQWQEWYNDSTRFQLFKNCLLVCQPSHNELVSRLLDFDPAVDQQNGPETDSQNAVQGSNILCNPQPGVFYLNEERYQHWYSKLDNAGIQLSKPFSAPKFSESNSRQSSIDNIEFPTEHVLSQWQAAPELGAAALPPCSEPLSQPFPWDNWPTNPEMFVRSRQLVCSNTDLKQLHIHFREARGVDYTAKRNLLHSLLTARNHMAIITLAEGDNFDLVPYTILPLSLDGPKEAPSLLALDLRQECLKQFPVKRITRVNEVFYSLINVCLLSLLPCDYIFAMEAEYQKEIGP